ncbi:MAG TPA: hypothetical protein EYP19_08035, partial [Desulfobacterales bacterium]|nr:hypothetical protein [Desulfobacterales bacterium]
MRNLVVLGLVTLLMACWSPQAWAKSATLTFSVTGTGPWTVSVNMNNDAAAAAVQLVIRYDSSKLSTTGSVSKTTRTTDMGIVDGNVPTAGELRIAIMDTDSPTPDVIAAGSGAIVSTTFSGTADVLYFTVDGVEKTAVFDDNGDAFNLVTYSYNLSTGSSEKRGESKDIASGTTGDVEFLDGSDTSGGVTIDLTTWPGGDVTVERKDDPVPGSYSGFTLLNLSWEIETTATGNFKMDITFNYTPALPLPAGMSEDELMIFHYDESAGTLKKVIEYTGVTLTRDTVANTITVHNWTGPLSPFGPGGLSPPTPVTLSR